MLVLPGCKLIYRQNVQQGNAIEQEDLDELYIGMNKRQVLFVLGTPSIKDPFHDDRWDYVQTFARRGGRMVQRTVTLRFEDDLLNNIIGLEDAFASADDADMGIPTYAPQAPDKEDAPDDVIVTVDPDSQAADINADTNDEDQDSDASQAGAIEPRKEVEPDIEGLGDRDSETREYAEEEEGED